MPNRICDPGPARHLAVGEVVHTLTKIISSLPLPAAGLMLGLAAAGSLVSEHGRVFKDIFGFLSAMVLALLILKIIFYTKTVVEDLKEPAIAGIAATFPMGMMVLSAYVCPPLYPLGYGMWASGILLQAMLICYFTRKFVFHVNLRKVFPSYFVVYVGIAAAGITAPLFSAAAIGRVLFWFGFVAYLALLPLILYRLCTVKPFPEPLLPTITIFAAPPCLCLVGYLNSFPEKNMALVWLLAFLSLISLAAVLLYMPVMLRLKFYPSYSAFTFPLVISALAVRNFHAFLLARQMAVPALKYLSFFVELLAILFVVYVLVRYIVFIVGVTVARTARAR